MSKQDKQLNPKFLEAVFKGWEYFPPNAMRALLAEGAGFTAALIDSSAKGESVVLDKGALGRLLNAAVLECSKRLPVNREKFVRGYKECVEHNVNFTAKTLVAFQEGGKNLLMPV